MAQHWIAAFQKLKERVIRDAKLEGNLAENTRLFAPSILTHIRPADVLVLADQDVAPEQLEKYFAAKAVYFDTQDKPVRIQFSGTLATRGNQEEEEEEDKTETQRKPEEAVVRAQLTPGCPTFNLVIMPRIAAVQTRAEQMRPAALRKMVLEEAQKCENGLAIMAIVGNGNDCTRSPTVGLVQELLQDYPVARSARVCFFSSFHANGLDGLPAAIRFSCSTSGTRKSVAKNLATLRGVPPPTFEALGECIPYRFRPEFAAVLERARQTLLSETAFCTEPAMSRENLVAAFTQNRTQNIHWAPLYQHCSSDWKTEYSKLQERYINALPAMPHYVQFRERFVARVRTVFAGKWSIVERDISVVEGFLKTSSSIFAPLAANPIPNWVLFGATTLNVLFPELLSPATFADLDASDDEEPQRRRLADLDASLKAVTEAKLVVVPVSEHS